MEKNEKKMEQAEPTEKTTVYFSGELVGSGMMHVDLTAKQLKDPRYLREVIKNSTGCSDASLKVAFAPFEPDQSDPLAVLYRKPAAEIVRHAYEEAKGRLLAASVTEDTFLWSIKRELAQRYLAGDVSVQSMLESMLTTADEKKHKSKAEAASSLAEKIIAKNEASTAKLLQLDNVMRNFTQSFAAAKNDAARDKAVAETIDRFGQLTKKEQ